MRRRRPGRGNGRRAPELSAATLEIRLRPRARRDEVVGERDGRIVVRVTAPPVEGRANEALRKLLAKQLGVAKSKVAVVRGERSRDKTVRIEGIGSDKARRLLADRPA